MKDVQRILITGATGFVGQSLMRYLHRTSLLGAETEVLLLARGIFEVPTEYEGRMSYIKADLTSTNIDISPCDVVFHCATPASASLNSDRPDEMLFLNLASMTGVIELAKKWRNHPRIVFTSSGTVYGDSLKNLECVSEDTPIANPEGVRDAYRLGKIRAEQMLLDATVAGICSGIICRLFAFSGPNLPIDSHFAVGNFIRDVVTRNVVTIRGDGTSIRSYLHEDDLAEWLFNACIYGSELDVFHIGSEHAITIKDLATLVCRQFETITGNVRTIEILGQSSKIDGVDRYVPCTRFTRQRLGLREKISLNESIDQMIETTLLKLL